MSLNVSDIIDFNEVVIYQYYSWVIFGSGVFSAIFYVIVVWKSTHKNLMMFRILTCMYIFCGIWAEVMFICWKPVRLPPFTIVYPVGILAPMTSQTSALLFSIYSTSLATMVEILAITIIERHLQIMNISGKNVKRQRIYIYFSMGLTFIITTSLFIIYVIKSVNDEVVRNTLITNVQNIEIILDSQPFLFALDFSMNIILILTFIALLGYIFCRIVLVTYVMKDYATYTKTTQQKFSEKTRRQFNLMFQSTMIQFFVTLSFALIALCYLLSYSIFDNSKILRVISTALIGVAMLYPTADVIIIISVISVYRNTVKKMFAKALKKKVEHVSRVGIPTVFYHSKSPLI